MGKLNYRIPNTNDFREIYVKVTDTLPIGAVCQYGGSTAPSGYLMCNGQAVSRTIYADLFKAIGTSFGSGDGVTTFNVPNFNGRVPVGLDGTQTEFDTLGETGGSKYLQEHYHEGLKWGSATGQDVSLNSGTGGGIQLSYTGGVQHDDVIYTAPAGTGDSGNLQPYQVVNFIIKASKKVALDRGNVVDSLDGSDTDSAPSVRAVNEALVETYSTDEVKTNKVWFGKPIYRKTIDLTSGWNIGSEIQLSHNIANVDNILKYEGTAYRADGQNQMIPSFIGSNDWLLSVFDMGSTKYRLYVGRLFTTSNALTHIYITFYYTKTTD